MNWRNVWLITSREVRDQLRDRRTLFMVLVLPLLLYPSLMIGVFELKSVFEEQDRTVVVLGADELPAGEKLNLLVGDRFNSQWFDSTDHVKKLIVVTDLPPTEGETTKEKSKKAPTPEERVRLLANAREVRDVSERRDRLERRLEELVGKPEEKSSADSDDEPASEKNEALSETAKKEAADVEAQLAEVKAELAAAFAKLEAQVLIVIPPGFAEGVESVEEREDVPHLEVRTVRNVADKKSHVAYSRVKEALEEWRREITLTRLEKADVSRALVTQFDLEETDVSSSEERAAQVWGMLFPAILVIMCVTGAFHPAVDVAAGEKERGTMETLLICPASRTEIVVGKFNAVFLFSLMTAMLNLVAMGLTAAYVASIGNAGSGMSTQLGMLAAPSWSAVVWVIVISLPLAALFSALCLALATFARSSKEGQYYLTPLLMITMGLTIFCMFPIAEIDPFTSVLPVLGPSLLLKELLATNGSLRVVVYAAPVLAFSFAYSALALWWAIDQFKREDVLFREAERFDFRLWMRHLMRDKEPTPSFAEAAVCFVLVMILQFAAVIPFQQYMNRLGVDGLPPSSGEYALRSMQVMMIQQLVVIATPALLMAVMLTTNPLRTLRIRWPNWRYLAAAVVLAVCLRPLAIEMMAWLGQWFFRPMPEWVVAQLALIDDGSIPLWLVLVTFAVIPGICEEIAFRGFILSGFDHSHRTWLAIVLSSLVFGIMHLVPQQVFHAFLMGLVIGSIAARSGSLLPCIVFHVISNGLAILVEQAKVGEIDSRWIDPLLVGTGAGARFSWTTLAVCSAVSGALIYWLVMRRFHVTDGVEPAQSDFAGGGETPAVDRRAAPVG